LYLKPSIECLRCTLAIRLKEVELSNLNNDSKLVLAKKLVLKVLEEFNWDIEITEFESNIFRYVISMAPGVVDYYRKLKLALNRKALENVKVHEEYARRLSGYERFNYLVKLSAVANLIDYGVADHKPLSGDINPEYVESFPVYRDDSRALYDMVVKGGQRVVWLFDNAGEAVYDALLIKEIKRMGNYVYGLVKDEPGFQNDLSISDLEYSGLMDVLDGVKGYGCNCSSIHLDHISTEARELVEKASVIIAKGMSHFEYLSEIDLVNPTVFVLIPKCDPVAKRVALGSTSSRGKIVVLLKGASGV